MLHAMSMEQQSAVYMLVIQLQDMQHADRERHASAQRESEPAQQNVCITTVAAVAAPITAEHTSNAICWVWPQSVTSAAEFSPTRPH